MKKTFDEFCMDNRYVNTAENKNGEYFYVCDFCGKRHKHRCGFEFNCNLDTVLCDFFAIRKSMCLKCFNKYKDKLFKIWDELGDLK